MNKTEKIKEEIDSHKQSIELHEYAIQNLQRLLENPSQCEPYLNGEPYLSRLRLSELSAYHIGILELEEKLITRYMDGDNTDDKHMDLYIGASVEIKWECLVWVDDLMSSGTYDEVGHFKASVNIVKKKYKLSSNVRSNKLYLQASWKVSKCQECGEWYRSNNGKYCSKKCSKKAANRRAKIARKLKEEKNDY